MDPRLLGYRAHSAKYCRNSKLLQGQKFSAVEQFRLCARTREAESKFLETRTVTLGEHVERCNWPPPAARQCCSQPEGNPSKDDDPNYHHSHPRGNDDAQEAQAMFHYLERASTEREPTRRSCRLCWVNDPTRVVKCTEALCRLEQVGRKNVWTR